jgi:hypothetical protein
MSLLSLSQFALEARACCEYCKLQKQTRVPLRDHEDVIGIEMMRHGIFCIDSEKPDLFKLISISILLYFLYCCLKYWPLNDKTTTYFSRD